MTQIHKVHIYKFLLSYILKCSHKQNNFWTHAYFLAVAVLITIYKPNTRLLCYKEPWKWTCFTSFPQHELLVKIRSNSTSRLLPKVLFFVHEGFHFTFRQMHFEYTQKSVRRGDDRSIFPSLLSHDLPLYSLGSFCWHGKVSTLSFTHARKREQRYSYDAL